MARGASHTGTEDKNYDLVSVLYHALQGAENGKIYTKDAEKAGDEELKKYFGEVEAQYRDIAERAKKMLAERIKE